MKKLLLFALLLLACSLGFQQPTHASKDVIVPTTANISLNGKLLEVPVYKINNSNYFQIRDMAEIMLDETSQFNLFYDAKNDAIELFPYLPYHETVGNHLYRKYTPYKVQAKTSTLKLGQKTHKVKTYLIDDYTYFKLRDLGELLNFEVDYDEKKARVLIESSPIPNVSSIPLKDGNNNNQKSANHPRWGNKHSEYVALNADGTKTIVELLQTERYQTENNITKIIFDNKINALTLNKHNQKIAEKQVTLELPLFGAFFSGEKYNYIAFGIDNYEQANKEVIRIVKYDKAFNKIDHASIYGHDAHTVRPFDASAGGQMAEYDNKLVFHTARTRYKSSDGLNHQSQLTIELNTDTMQVTNTLGAFQENHVSHSFDQFALIDQQTKMPVYLDHGDAFPRSIALHNMGLTSRDKEMSIFNIAGATGANVTGVSVSGFEQSNTHYLVAFNSINQNNSYNYTSFELVGGDVNKRNIYIYGVDKESTPQNMQLQKTEIANYEKSTLYSTTPTLVKINDNRFLVLWQEYDQSKMLWHPIKYVYIDGTGNITSKTNTLHHFFMLSQTQPIVVGDRILWTTVGTKYRHIFEMDIQ